jgi:hypothetical protein
MRRSELVEALMKVEIPGEDDPIVCLGGTVLSYRATDVWAANCEYLTYDEDRCVCGNGHHILVE